MPTLEVATVAEAIAKAVLAGNGDQIVVPGFGNVTTLLKGFPHWLQRKMRTDGVKIMKKWHGRQVIDVERDYGVQKQEQQQQQHHQQHLPQQQQADVSA